MNYIKFKNKTIAPSKVICIGRNYVEHIEELNNEMPDSMVVFNKPNSAISNELHYISEDTRFEGEICFLIEDSQISGIGFGLDLTKADIQNKMKSKGLPWERAKAFDNSAVLSEFIPLDKDVSTLRFELFINDKLTQFADYDLMIYKPRDMLKEIQSFMSFEDGDIIMSGTPKGVGNYKKGDIFTAKIYSDDELLLNVQWEVK
jgi:2-keto-4-pentenoate hydratase/2-oxohepta-3-ene-1,7-dioic acid hydratase in catechol pathway